MRALENLLRTIDDERSIIFLHADRKWKEFDPTAISAAVMHAELHILKDRIRVTWGGVSQIRIELALMEAAVQRGEWSYCHLLSGQDICIKTQDEVHAFFEANRGKEFLTFCGRDWNEKAQERVRYFFPEVGRSGLGSLFMKIARGLQRLFHIDRRKHDNVQWVGGSNWASLTYAFAAFLVARRDEILRRMRRTYCADELYKQTIAFNSEFKESIYLLKIADKNDDTDPAMNLANMRRIDWVRGRPYTFTEKDLPELLSSPCMFARKVSLALSQKYLKHLLQGEAI